MWLFSSSEVVLAREELCLRVEENLVWLGVLERFGVVCWVANDRGRSVELFGFGDPTRVWRWFWRWSQRQRTGVLDNIVVNAEVK